MGPSSTPPLPRRARPAARVVGLDGTLIGLNTNRLDDGFYLALPADAALAERLAALGRGDSPKRRRLGVGLAPGTRRDAFGEPSACPTSTVPW